jgi:hypothetical protein
METEIEKFNEVELQVKEVPTIKLYNPEGMDFTKTHRIKCLEATDEYTRIDFVYRSSMIWDNGGWIQMDRDAYIQPKGSTKKYTLIKAIGIPIAPVKHYFKRQGEYYTYTLIFPALPKNTTCIDIIEREAPGTYFNFYNIDYSNWMTVPHAADLPTKQN